MSLHAPSRGEETVKLSISALEMVQLVVKDPSLSLSPSRGERTLKAPFNSPSRGEETVKDPFHSSPR